MHSMKTKNILGLLLLILISCTYVVAQGQVLTFKEAVNIALKENVSIKSQYNQLQTFQAQRLNNRAQYLPNVGISGGGSRTDGQQINNQTGVGENITSDYFQAGLGASMSLFNGMSRIANLKSANANIEAQSYSIARNKQQIIVDVANQYLQVLLDQELLKISQQNLETQKKLLEQIRTFKELGIRPITDLYNQEAQVKNLEVQVLRSENALRNDKSILAQILQIEPVLDFEVVYPDWDVNTINMEGIDLTSLYEKALANRSDLMQMKTQEQSLKYQIRSATSGYFPSLNIFANYGSFYQNTKGAENVPSFSDQFVDLNPQLQYGFSFNIPIFDQFRAKNSRVAARMQFVNAQNSTSNLEKTVKIDIQRSYQNFNDATTNYSASQAQLRAADLAFKTQKESYELGGSNQVELSQANQLYIQALASKTQAELTLLFQKIMLDYNVGTLRYEDIP